MRKLRHLLVKTCYGRAMSFPAQQSAASRGHLLVALDQRAQRDAFELTLLAPAAPIARAIQLSGLDRILPFAAPVDAVDTHPGEPALAARESEALADVS